MPVIAFAARLVLSVVIGAILGYVLIAVLSTTERLWNAFRPKKVYA